jgi:hypothetical protein
MGLGSHERLLLWARDDVTAVHPEDHGRHQRKEYDREEFEEEK